MMAKEAQLLRQMTRPVAFDTDPQDDSSLSANTSAAARNETQEGRTLICYLPFEPPSINMHILLTVLHIFLMLLVGRI